VAAEAGGEAGAATAGAAGDQAGEAGMAGEGGAASGGTAGFSGAGGNEAGAGSGGEAGDAGGEVEEPFEGPCPGSTLGGWASVAGLDFDPTVAPTPGEEVVVTDAESLVSYASHPDPYVIRISGTIAVPVLDVSSNKIILGDNALATLEGGIRIAGTSTAPSDMVSNVVIRNLRINAASADTSELADEDDGIMIAYAHHVWIDHVDVWDAPGDNLDVINGSDYVTVSWTKFRHVTSIRRTGARVGHSDANAAEDEERLKVTFHHNWWTDSVDQRMPRVRFGDVHVFNDYYSNKNPEFAENSYCIAAGLSARLVVENNFFDESTNPHVFFSFANGVASFTEPTAQIVATDNTYLGASDAAGGKLAGQGEAFVPPYSFTLEAADGVLRNTIRHCAGTFVE
jgi:pectate lyase